jgi:hypothetical protein
MIYRRKKLARILVSLRFTVVEEMNGEKSKLPGSFGGYAW